MSIDRKKLAQWLRQQMQSMETEIPCVRMVLKHALATGKTGQVAQYPITPSTDPDSLGLEIVDAATTDAEGLGELQRYSVCAYYKGNEDEVKSRFSFRIHIAKDEDDSSGLSESPDSKGLTSQMMRHTEAMMRSSTIANAETARILLRTVERQAETIETLSGKHIAMLETMEEVMGAKDERELKKLELVAKMKRDEAIIDKLNVLLPAVVNRLGGKKLLPEKATPSEMMVGQLLGSLTPDQFQTLSGTFRPDQMMIVMELYDTFKQRHEADQKAKEAKEAENGAAPTTSIVTRKPD